MGVPNFAQLSWFCEDQTFDYLFRFLILLSPTLPGSNSLSWNIIAVMIVAALVINLWLLTFDYFYDEIMLINYYMDIRDSINCPEIMPFSSNKQNNCTSLEVFIGSLSGLSSKIPSTRLKK